MKLSTVIKTIKTAIKPTKENTMKALSNEEREIQNAVRDVLLQDAPAQAALEWVMNNMDDTNAFIVSEFNKKVHEYVMTVNPDNAVQELGYLAQWAPIERLWSEFGDLDYAVRMYQVSDTIVEAVEFAGQQFEMAEVVENIGELVWALVIDECNIVSGIELSDAYLSIGEHILSEGMKMEEVEKSINQAVSQRWADASPATEASQGGNKLVDIYILNMDGTVTGTTAPGGYTSEEMTDDLVNRFYQFTTWAMPFVDGYLVLDPSTGKMSKEDYLTIQSMSMPLDVFQDEYEYMMDNAKMVDSSFADDLQDWEVKVGPVLHKIRTF